MARLTRKKTDDVNYYLPEIKDGQCTDINGQTKKIIKK